MADKTYKLKFNLTDGSTEEVQFTAPQGPQGEKGDKGDKGDPGAQGATGETGATGADGVGIASVTIEEV